MQRRLPDFLLAKEQNMGAEQTSLRAEADKLDDKQNTFSGDFLSRGGIKYSGEITGDGQAKVSRQYHRVDFQGGFVAKSCECPAPVAAAAAAVPAVATAAAGGLAGGGRGPSNRLFVALLLGMFIYMLLRTPRRDEQAY